MSMYDSIEVFKPNRNKDKDRLYEAKEEEKRKGKTLTRVNISKGYVMTTNRDSWKIHEVNGDKGKTTKRHSKALKESS